MSRCLYVPQRNSLFIYIQSLLLIKVHYVRCLYPALASCPRLLRHTWASIAFTITVAAPALSNKKRMVGTVGEEIFSIEYESYFFFI